MTGRSRFFLLAAQLAAIVGGFALLRTQWPELNLSFVQLLVFPLVLSFFVQLRVGATVMPRALVLSAAAAALIAFGVPYFRAGGTHRLLVSTLGGDDLESESRVFWQGLDTRFEQDGAVQAARFYGTFTSHAGALAALQNYPQAIGVVWGTPRWINLSFRNPAIINLAAAGVGKGWEGVTDLLLVTGVPIVGLSYEPRGDSEKFIAALFTGIQSLTQDTQQGRALAETNLLYAAGRQAFWASNAHRGLAWFLLGTLYTKQAFAEGGYQRSLARCAETAFIAAGMNLLPKDNPELYAAIGNNLGVLYFLQGQFEEKRLLQQRARRKWKLAAQTRRLKNPFKVKYLAASVAKTNFELAQTVLKRPGSEPHRATRRRKKHKRGGVHAVHH